MNYSENLPVKKLDNILQSKITEFNGNEAKLITINHQLLLIRNELNSLCDELTYLADLENLQNAKCKYNSLKEKEKNLARERTVLNEKIEILMDDIKELRTLLRSKVLGKDLIIEINKAKHKDEETKKESLKEWKGERSEFVQMVLDKFTDKYGFEYKGPNKLFIVAYYKKYTFPKYPDWTFQKFDSAFRVAKSRLLKMHNESI